MRNGGNNMASQGHLIYIASTKTHLTSDVSESFVVRHRRNGCVATAGADRTWLDDHFVGLTHGLGRSVALRT